MSHPVGPETTPTGQDVDLRDTARPTWMDTQVLHADEPQHAGPQYLDADPEDDYYQPMTDDGSTAAPEYYEQSEDLEWDDEPIARGFGGPTGAFLALLTSGLIAGLLAAGPSLPARAGSRGWAILLTALDVDGPRTIATWWGVVLMTLTAAWSWAAAGRARRGRRWLRMLAWGLLGLVMLGMSASHLLALHTQVAQLASVRRLGVPSFVAQHPVELIIAAALALPSLILLIGSSSAQRALLVLGGALYLVGTLVVGSGRWNVSSNGQYQHVAEVAFEWTGIALVMLAAGLERVRPRRR